MLVSEQSSGADNALHARVAVALFAELIVLSVEPMASLFCSFFFLIFDSVPSDCL